MLLEPPESGRVVALQISSTPMISYVAKCVSSASNTLCEKYVAFWGHNFRVGERGGPHKKTPVCLTCKMCLLVHIRVPPKFGTMVLLPLRLWDMVNPLNTWPSSRCGYQYQNWSLCVSKFCGSWCPALRVSVANYKNLTSPRYITLEKFLPL